MLDTLKNATHVLKTSEAGIEVLSFNQGNSLIGRFKYDTRQGAIKALERLTGRAVTLKPMQTEAAERVETGVEINDDNLPDE